MTIRPGAKHRGSIAVAIALVCAACTTPAAKEPAGPPPEFRQTKAHEKSRAEQDFARGVKSYEDGDYKSAARQLESALSLGLPAFRDQAAAHKYLAFVACASGRQRPCRDEFRKALEADGNLNLTPAEAGHPVWGPVFRSVKAETAKARPKVAAPRRP